MLPYDVTTDLPALCERLIAAGIDEVAQPLRPHKAFLCHSSSDKPMVERIVQRLKRAEILTFYDRHDIGVGMSISETIRQAITEVGYVIVCLSPPTPDSPWVRAEIARRVRLRRRPVR